MSENLRKRFEDLIAYIIKANEDVLDGRIRRLNDLDQNIEKLCQDTLATEAIIAKQMQPLMGEMISRLDELASNLKEFKKQHEERS